MEIRKAVKEDLHLVQAIGQETYRQHFARPLVTSRA